MTYYCNLSNGIECAETCFYKNNCKTRTEVIINKQGYKIIRGKNERQFYNGKT